MINSYCLSLYFYYLFFLSFCKFLQGVWPDATLLVAIFAILFSGMTAGNNGHFMPDVAASKAAAANIFEIQDGVDEDQLQA